MKKIADNDAWTLPATIEDPKALDDIAAALEARGQWGRGRARTASNCVESNHFRSVGESGAGMPPPSEEPKSGEAS
jgi:hypothetical protein